MRRLIVAAVLIAGATSARAEAWTCTYVMEGIKEPYLRRLQVSPPDLIDETQYGDHYRILQNNEYGLVAASAISTLEQGQQKPTVGANTVVINKQTGEFWWGALIAGPQREAFLNIPVQGKCIKD